MSGAAKSKLTSTVSESSSKSNPAAISPVVGALSSVPPESEASIAEPCVLNVLAPSESVLAALAAARVNPASSKFVSWSIQRIYSD